MKKSKAILLLLRLPFLTVTIGAVFVGTAFARWHQNEFALSRFLLVLFGSCFFHIACNVANDYFDFKSGNDALNKNAITPFSGGSRMVLDGFVQPKQALTVSIVFAVLGSVIGIYLNAISSGNIVLFIGIAALFLVYGYNGFPLRLVNKGLGEIAIFLAWGPFIVLGSYYVQAQNISSFWPWIVAIPSGILTTLVLLINEFADKEADEATGRKTWVILFGFEASLLIYLFLALSCYAVVLIGVFFGDWPLLSLLVFVTLPMPILSFRLGMQNLGNWAEFFPAIKNTILMNFLFLVILSGSYLV
ncbi:MAG: prenyltransferase [Candidatus Aminicenantes bacterium]|nr:MAG: prenyltransferase [Candidatus Aminicenantes bacterium]